MTRLLLGCALVLALAGCQKKDEQPAGPPDQKPAPRKPLPGIPAHEAARGQQACTAWMDRICTCAADHPDLAATCAEAKSLPNALTLAVQATTASGLDGPDRARLELEARKIIARCIEEQGKLDPARCPRTAVPAPAAPAQPTPAAPAN